MKTEFKLNFIVTIFMLLSVFTFSSCDNPIALGKRLNLDPPVVTIDKPDFMENIKGTLELEGTATDLEEVVLLLITVERTNKDGNEWKRELRGDRGHWQSRSGVNAAWQTTSGLWSIQGSKGNINWSINVPMDGAPDGEYLITVGAENNVKNSGSLVQLRVVIDNEAPVVTVFTPVLEFDDDDGKGNTYTYAGDVLPQFNTYKLEDPAIMDKLHNKRIGIQYEIKDDFSIDTLVFQLADNAGAIYYNSEKEPVPSLSWSGKTEISGDNITDATGSLAANGKLYLQLISIATDKAGNEKTHSHGWMVWWPAADLPWVTGVGTELETAAEIQFSVFPGTDVQGEAYDNDGVRKVSYQIFRKGNDGTYALYPDNNAGEQILINTPLVEGADPSTFFAWRFTAPVNFGTYKIVMNCEDVLGTAGNEKVRYFYVQDISAPNVVISSPDQNESLFGNSTGAFTMQGQAGSGDTIGPVKLTMVWIKPLTAADAYNNTRIEYQSSDYAGWALLDEVTSTATDTYGNKLWDLTSSLGAPTYDNDRTNKPFTKALNLFGSGADALDIGPNAPLASQTFIFRVEANNGRATTQVVSFRGDVDPPEIAITKIIRERLGDDIPVINYEIEDGVLYEIIPPSTTRTQVDTMRSLATGDKVTITGTWQDNSIPAWDAATRNGKMGPLTVTWNGTPVAGGVLDYTSYNNATGSAWTTGQMTVSETEALKGGGFIIASLEDLGGNKAQTTASVKVDTQIPVLLLFSAEEENGYYNSPAGTRTLSILMEFNKPVVYNSTDVPELTLNTEGGTGIAYYDRTGKNPPHTAALATEGSRTHYFTYTIASTHNTPAGGRLDVTAIDPKTGKWAATGGNAVMVLPDRNLANTKNIIIDNTAPQVLRIESLSGTAAGDTNVNNYYKSGVIIYLRVVLNEPINYASGAVMTLNATSGGNDSSAGGTAITVSNPTPSGPTALLFEYATLAGHNTAVTGTPPVPDTASPLSVTALTLTGVTDLAGNETGAVTIGSVQNISEGPNTTARRIFVDTIAPGAPTLTLDPADSSTTPPVTYAVATTEANAIPEYSTREAGGQWTPWRTWTDNAPALNSVGTFEVRARQIDLAKNATVEASYATKSVAITESKPLLESMGGSPSGTYGGPGMKSVDIELRLREIVTVTGTPSMTLNVNKVSGTAVAVYDPTATTAASSTEKTVLVFKYTIDDGDSVNELHINSITMTGVTLTTTAAGRDVTHELPLGPAATTSGGWADGRGLEAYTKIRINTVGPKLTNAVLNATGTLLTLTFDNEIYKGTGSVALTQVEAYQPPAVMSKTEYQKYGGAAVLGSYYTAGTYGTNASGVPDQAEKYILNFEIDPADATADTLRAALIGKNANKVTVPVVSSAVARNDNILTVDLSSAYGYVLPVKGVTYTIEIPETLVQDSQNNPIASGTGDYVIASNKITFTRNNPGVNEPFIRVEKKSGELVQGQIRLPGTTDHRWILNANISRNRPASGDWLLVNPHYIENPVYYEGNGAPTNTEQYFETYIPIPYWVSSAAEIRLTNPNDSDNWDYVPAYWMHGPFTVAFDPSITTTNPSYIAAGNGTAYIRMSWVQTTAPADTTGWVQVGNVSVQIIADPENPGRGMWVTGQNGSPTQFTDPVSGATSENAISQSYNSASLWVRIDSSATPQAENPNDNRWLQVAPYWENNVQMGGVPRYVQLGSGRWSRDQWTDGNPWGTGNDSINLANYLSNGGYWVSRANTTHFTTTNMHGTAGWARVDRYDYDYRWIELGKGTWRDWAGNNDEFVPAPAYYVERNVGTGWTGGNGNNANCVPVDIYTPGNPSGTTAVAKQPFQTSVRIDSQTPDAVIRYRIDTTPVNPYSGGSNGIFSYLVNPADEYPGPRTITPPTNTTGVYSTALSLGVDNDYSNGYLYAIRAEATKNASAAVVSFERAARSVIRFTNVEAAGNWGTLSGLATDGRVLQLWIRGGDGTSGGNLTPGFPLSWDESDWRTSDSTKPSGAKLFTQTDDGEWYWITWGVTDRPAYFHFQAGTTSTLAEAYKGPVNWTWAKNAWAFQKQEFPLYPGGSLQFSVGIRVSNPATETFEFYNIFNGTRP